MRARSQQYQLERFLYRLIELFLKLLIGIFVVLTVIPLLIGAILVYILHSFQLSTGLDNSPILRSIKRWYELNRKNRFDI